MAHATESLRGRITPEKAQQGMAMIISRWRHQHNRKLLQESDLPNDTAGTTNLGTGSHLAFASPNNNPTLGPEKTHRQGNPSRPSRPSISRRCGFIDLSVIIPAYNETSCLPSVLEMTLNHPNSASICQTRTYELVIADYGYKDDTSALALKSAQQHLKSNISKGGATLPCPHFASKAVTHAGHICRGGDVRIVVVGAIGDKRQAVVFESDGETYLTGPRPGLSEPIHFTTFRKDSPPEQPNKGPPNSQLSPSASLRKVQGPTGARFAEREEGQDILDSCAEGFQYVLGSSSGIIWRV
ncbi:hypothetical protein EDB19DRAFT_2025762 [Suillus lakei]|nr:hypothetical protein EDB19DRAFT_2025762 [Suillus lakei]